MQLPQGEPEVVSRTSGRLGCPGITQALPEHLSSGTRLAWLAGGEQLTPSQAQTLGRAGTLTPSQVGLDEPSQEMPGVPALTQQPHFCPPVYTHR